ncbi:hypothetical protein D3C75_126510 [compost metagenome]
MGRVVLLHRMGGGFGHKPFLDLSLFEEAVVTFSYAVHHDITVGVNHQISTYLCLSTLEDGILASINAQTAAGDFGDLLAYGLLHPQLAAAVACLILPVFHAVKIYVSLATQKDVAVTHQHRRLRVQIMLGM